jgi:hypothetical protein
MPLRDDAVRYFKNGWHPLELPAHAKSPPPEGRTGREGIDMTLIEIEAAAWSGNIGLRMPVDVIGLDVDVYRGGMVALNELFAKCGPLPNTWISHSGRNDGSGIRFFRVPVGLSWVTALPGIDIIQRGHRYAAVYPSIHPDGRQYGWWDQAELAPTFDLPEVELLPELPWPWIEELSQPDSTSTHSRAVDETEGHEFIAAHDTAEAAGWTSKITQRFTERTKGGYSRHDTMQHCLTWAMECARAGIIAAWPVIKALGDLWREAVKPDARRMELYSPHRTTEFQAMLRHAIGKAIARPQADIDQMFRDVVGVRFLVPAVPVASSAPVIATYQPLPVSLRQSRLTPTSAIGLRPVKWLWHERIALGTLALLGGREGIGKSILTYQLAADISKGRLPGEFEHRRKSVLVCATEDSWEHTIAPRLTGADADLDRVFRLDITVDGTPGALTLPVDLGALEEAILDSDAALIVLDPLMSRLSVALDTHKDAEVRVALEPLVALADRTRAAVVGLIHVNKSASVDPLSMLMASRAFTAVARSVMFVAQDPEPGSAKRFLGQAKNNLGTMRQPLLAFEIDSKLVAQTAEGDVWTGVVNWQGTDPRSLVDIIQASATPIDADAADALQEATYWLNDWLVMHEVAPSQDVKTAASKAGHSASTLKRARASLGAGITSHGFPRVTWWSKPGLTPDQALAEITKRTATTP